MDVDGQIQFTDIAASGFKPKVETGKSLQTLMREIHARLLKNRESESDTNAKWFTGVDVFREMYRRIGFTRSVAFSRFPVVDQLLKFGYQIFAWFRFQFAFRRMNRAELCEGVCRTDNPLSDQA